MAAAALDARAGDRDEQAHLVLADWSFHCSGGERGR